MAEKRIKKEAKKESKGYRSAMQKRMDLMEEADPSYSKRGKKSNSNKS